MKKNKILKHQIKQKNNQIITKKMEFYLESIENIIDLKLLKPIIENKQENMIIELNNLPKLEIPIPKQRKRFKN